MNQLIRTLYLKMSQLKKKAPLRTACARAIQMHLTLRLTIFAVGAMSLVLYASSIENQIVTISSIETKMNGLSLRSIKGAIRKTTSDLLNKYLLFIVKT